MRPAVGLAALAAIAVSAPASAITVISFPDAAYRSATTLIGMPASPSERSFWGDADLMVSFSTPLLPRTVGMGWATWGSPPETEQDNPRVFWTQGVFSLEFGFSTPLTVWGFEAEPTPFAVFDVTAEFYNGATLLGTITRPVDGNAGARLFAAIADPGDSFTSVRVTSGADFAVAQLRYTLSGTIVPEPATWAMMIAGFGVVGLSLRRRVPIARHAA